MPLDTLVTFKVFIDGKQTGSMDKWHRTPITITSVWRPGSEQEKFEVLAAIRKTYNPNNKAGIRGCHGETPSQIGRAEGFKELHYSRATSPDSVVVIVPPVMQHLRLVPQSNVGESSPVSSPA